MTKDEFKEMIEPLYPSKEGYEVKSDNAHDIVRIYNPTKTIGCIVTYRITSNGNRVDTSPAYKLHVRPSVANVNSPTIVKRAELIKASVENAYQIKLKNDAILAAKIATAESHAAELSEEYGDYFEVDSYANIVVAVGNVKCKLSDDNSTATMRLGGDLWESHNVPLEMSLRMLKEYALHCMLED